MEVYMAYEVINSQTVFKGMLIEVEHETVCLPDGRQVQREVVNHAPAAAILPVDDDGNLIFVRQYRYPIKQMALELPAGLMEPGESPSSAAARELEEEIGKKPAKLTYLFKFYSSIGISTEEIYIYMAENLIDSHQHLDADEFVTLERYSPQEALLMIQNGTIVDSKTTAAVLYYLAMAK
jgi:ADP-ribose pyrophosphatase